MLQLNTCYECLHRHPERSRQEYKTAERITEWLREMDIEVTRIGETAVVGTLHGGLPGKTVALRADMDALPVTETTGLPYASENKGVMHACGHDFHMTAALGAAQLLSNSRESLQGTVQFVFQPDEEEDGYAAILSKHDIMKDTVAVFGAHVDPTLPAGCFGFREGPFYATAGKFDVLFEGKSAHGATPEQGKDALSAAAMAVPMLLSLRSEEAVISVGTLHSGTVRNIISDRAELTGILRVAGTELRKHLYGVIAEHLKELENNTGVRITPRFENGYSGITNPKACTALARAAAAELCGEDAIRDIDRLLPITEDFGEYLEGRDGTFYHIGVGGDEGLHSSSFAPDPALLENAAALHAHIIREYLKQE